MDRFHEKIQSYSYDEKLTTFLKKTIRYYAESTSSLLWNVCIA